MRNIPETGPARLDRRQRVRRPPHGAPFRPTTPASPAFASIALAAGALALGGLLHALPAQAIEFGDGDLQGSLDTTISHGMTYRVAKRDARLASGANDNDGNLNYDRGLVSNASKFTTDLDIGVGGFGAFLRATGFVDHENRNGRRERTPLSDAAQDRVGRDLEVLDAYVAAAFDAGDAAFDFRLGKHVLNWGESTFIPNGINAINPFDVSKLRRPGSELREALLPVGLVSLSVAPTDLLSVEGFYQLDWEPTEIDPVGSYFSVTDYAGPGAEKAVIALPGLDLGDMGLTEGQNPFTIFSSITDPTAAAAFAPLTSPDPDFLIAPRHPDREADDSGQWGIAVRYLAEGLNDTELGFYYMNYHSRLPVVGAHTGTRADALAGLQAAGAIGAAAPTAVPQVVTAAVTAAVAQALAAAGCASAGASAQCGALAARVQAETTPQATAQVTALAEGAAAAAGIDAYAEEGYYFLEYPEDIQLFGVSFSTELGASGWALQGEYSYRRDAPLQFAERKVFADALAPFTGIEDCVRQKVPALIAAGVSPQDAQLQAPGACVADNAAAGLYDADTVGYLRRNVSQVQATATRVFGPNELGADAMVFLAEAALMRVHDMPKGKGVASPGPGDFPLESPAGGTHGTGKADADATSWGYRVAGRLDYNNAIGAVNLYPYTQFLHDVSGNSPAPAGPFVEGRTALTLGLRADYLSRWEADIGYTRYSGKGTELADRDFISASVKYSF